MELTYTNRFIDEIVSYIDVSLSNHISSRVSSTILWQTNEYWNADEYPWQIKIYKDIKDNGDNVYSDGNIFRKKPVFNTILYEEFCLNLLYLLIKLWLFK